MTFLTGIDLSEKIYDTIYNSEEYLLILSPSIQLDNYCISCGEKSSSYFKKPSCYNCFKKNYTT